MYFLKEIFREDVINTEGRTLHREAVRGIILQQHTILMIYSPVNGDYKFPGGGVDENESCEKALIREVQEECGAVLSHISQEVGCVIEYSIPREINYDVFKMTSRYFLCNTDDDFREQNLDQYEQDLGFRPVRVDIDTAIQTNNAILDATDRKIPPWTDRETLVLKYIKENILLKNSI
ncbi:MAG: NUDIX domain-containing protein [Candidatus Sabulitectum sp.]|nr:NUDIX domain-containing protein [Candidatus Sabulitectum sp.]